jgi:Ca-activated chloride channel family protein
MRIQPKGKTPISRSLRKAADDLRYTEEKATIILISDGKETCDPDPCGTAKQLKKEGIDFITHVIGFNVDKKTDKQLACIAHATGGEYFSAKNAKELNKAIKVVAKKVEKPKPVVPKETLLIPHVRYDMLPRGLDITGVKLTVAQDGKKIYSGDEVAPKIKAKVGEVQIEAQADFGAQKQTVQQNVTLDPQKENHVVLLVKSGKVTVDTAEEAGGPKVLSDVHNYPVVEGVPDMADEASWCDPT